MKENWGMMLKTKIVKGKSTIKIVKGKGSKFYCVQQREKFVLWSLDGDTGWFCAQ